MSAGEQERKAVEVGVAGKPTASEWKDAEKHQGLCIRTAWQVGRRKSWSRRGYELEDLQHEGMLITLRALRGFDASLGYAFSSYLSRALWNGYTHLWRKRAVVESASSGSDALERESLEPSAEDTLMWQERRSLVRAASKKLPCREHVVLKKRYGGGHVVALEHIGAELGVCRERARQIERDAIQHVREIVYAAEDTEDSEDRRRVPGAGGVRVRSQ